MGPIDGIKPNALNKQGQGVDGTPGPRESSFADLKEALKDKPDWLTTLGGGAAHHELQKVREQLVKGKAFGARELLLFQMQASELNLRVELFAKVADSALSSIRRLQNSQ